MTRHFIPTVSERKDKRKHRKRGPTYSPKKQPKMRIWVFSIKPKKTDTTRTYIVSLAQKLDPNIFYERLNQLIPDTTVKVDNPDVPNANFIVILSNPLTMREIYSKTGQALAGLI